MARVEAVVELAHPVIPPKPGVRPRRWSLDNVLGAFSSKNIIPAADRRREHGVVRLGAALAIAAGATVGAVGALFAPVEASQLLQQALNNSKNPGKSGKVEDPSRGSFQNTDKAAGNIRIILPASLRNTTFSGESTPERTPTPALGSATFNYDIGPGVPTDDVNLIKEGISLARIELQSQYGGDIQRPTNSPMTVKIVADGTGDGCCSALEASGARPYFDVLHNLWRIMKPIDKKIAAAHETTHAWHNSLGCLNLTDHRLPDWLEEGTAHFVPYGYLIRTGVMDEQVTRYLHFSAAESTGQLSRPLSSLEHPAPIYPGHVGYVAVDRLVTQASSGRLSLRTVCELVSGDVSRLTIDQAFLRVFGQSRNDFYAGFPGYIQSLKTAPVYLKLAGRLPNTEPNKVSYRFHYAAYGYEKLSASEQFAAWGLPAQMCGWGAEQLGEMNIALCNGTEGRSYPIVLKLPDGRKAQLDVVYSTR